MGQVHLRILLYSWSFLGGIAANRRAVRAGVPPLSALLSPPGRMLDSSRVNFL